MTNLQGIIFDLGHTLMEFHGEWDDVEERGGGDLIRFFRDQGIFVSNDFVKSFVEKRHEEGRKSDITSVEYKAEEALREMIKEFNLNGKAEQLVSNALEAFFAAEVESWTAYPDSLEVLAALKSRGYRLGMISNATDHAFILRCAKKLGFEPFFEEIVSSANFHCRKPHPQIFWSMANRWGTKYEQVVMIGDQPYYDVFGAKSAGMKSILISRSSDKAHNFIPQNLLGDSRLFPDRAAKELSEIPGLLETFQE